MILDEAARKVQLRDGMIVSSAQVSQAKSHAQDIISTLPSRPIHRMRTIGKVDHRPNAHLFHRFVGEGL